MPLVPLSLTTTSRRARFRQEGNARLVNCYVEEIGEEGKHPWAIYPIDGLAHFGMLRNGGEVRAMLPVGSTLYVVAGRQVYAVDGAGTDTLLGSIATDGLVTMAVNRKQPNPQIGIVCGGLYYVIEGNVLTQVNDPDLEPPICIIERDGYFLLPVGNGRFYWTGINDATSIDGLDFAAAESRSDPNVMAATRGTDNIIFGTQSMEFWQNVGSADIPFARVQVANIGCYAAGSVAEVTAVINGATIDSVAWAASDEQGGYLGVMLLSGYSGQKISDPELDRLIRRDPSPQSIRGFSWSSDGHTFYAISGTGYTWVYDTTTGTWHERLSHGRSRWRCGSHAQFGSRHVFGDIDTNRLYASDPERGDEVGDPIVMTVQTPPVHAFPYAVKHNCLYVDVVAGVGLDSTAPEQSDPRLMIDWSDDGGFTWSTQRQERLGGQGERQTRVRAHRLGTAYSRTYRLSCSASVARCITNAQLDVERLAR